jgi:hypothetical protein
MTGDVHVGTRDSLTCNDLSGQRGCSRRLTAEFALSTVLRIGRRERQSRSVPLSDDKNAHAPCPQRAPVPAAVVCPAQAPEAGGLAWVSPIVRPPMSRTSWLTVSRIVIDWAFNSSAAAAVSSAPLAFD